MGFESTKVAPLYETSSVNFHKGLIIFVQFSSGPEILDHQISLLVFMKALDQCVWLIYFILCQISPCFFVCGLIDLKNAEKA